ncbi:hypothetical protein GQ44DRAFT_829937 [Phaeosphaeriaceae sp. PMI808]|nr:hypothetical protein GQ44DRAFT_829937 [Phaeosphaeriaceae sp. PMI808]
MHFITFASTFALLGLVHAAPAPASPPLTPTIYSPTDFPLPQLNCPPKAPFVLGMDPASIWFSICTGYAAAWADSCNRGVGPGPSKDDPYYYRPCTDPFFH